MLFRNNTLVTIFILIPPNIPIQYLLIRPGLSEREREIRSANPNLHEFSNTAQKQLELRLVFVS